MMRLFFFFLTDWFNGLILVKPGDTIRKARGSRALSEFDLKDNLTKRRRRIK